MAIRVPLLTALWQRWRGPRVCLYTALIDNYDSLHQQDLHHHDLHRQHGTANLRMLCFTDQAGLQSSQFEVRTVPRSFEDPSRDARYFKILPHRVLPQCDVSVWIDASFQFEPGVNVAAWAIERLQGKAIAVLEHPNNDDVYHELMRCKRYKKDDPAVLDAQVERYRSEGFPENSGMVATGIIIRDHRRPECKDFCEHWWREIASGSRRDQISFNYVAWKTQIPFAIIEKLEAKGCFSCSVGKFHDHLK